MNQAALNRPGSASDRRLAFAIGLSLAFHAFLLTLHFQFPEVSKSMREKALDIILVNTKSATKPTEAQALAQANLDGGGNTDENRRIKTPLPPTSHRVSGDDIQQMQRRVQELETRQQALMTQARNLRSTAASQAASEQPAPAPSLSGLDLAESARAMARLEGEISKSTDEYNKRPRRKFIGVRTQEYRFARYIEDWRQKIERIGTLNYPSEARGKLYGSLVLTVSIRADGCVVQIVINRSSGYRLLDDSAKRIVQMASPYSPFPPDIQHDTDILEITRTWYFTQGDQLSSK